MRTGRRRRAARGGGGARGAADCRRREPSGLARPTGAYMPDQMNSVDITMRQVRVTFRLNGGSLGGGGWERDRRASASTGRSRCTSAARRRRRFKDVAYADLNARPFEADKTSPNFRVQPAERVLLRLLGGDRRHQPRRQHGRHRRVRTTTYGPDFTVGRQFYAASSYNPTSEWPLLSMVQPRLRLDRRRLAGRPQHERQRRRRHRHALRQSEGRKPPLGSSRRHAAARRASSATRRRCSRTSTATASPN